MWSESAPFSQVSARHITVITSPGLRGWRVFSAWRMRRRALILIQRCALLSLLLLPAVLVHSSERFNEYPMKAAYLFNFLKFTKWPDEERMSPSAPFTLCVYSADPLTAHLRSVEQKQVRDRAVRVQLYDSALDVHSCHILYLSRVPNAKRYEILFAVRGLPILTVSDEGAYPIGHEAVNFFIERGRLKFEVNYRALQESGVQMSSRLLNLARVNGMW